VSIIHVRDYSKGRGSAIFQTCFLDGTCPRTFIGTPKTDSANLGGNLERKKCRYWHNVLDMAGQSQGVKW
jgi:hypothetical protein